MVNPAFVLLPLYLYPYNDTSWSNITKSIAANPELNYQIIVAPNLENIFPDKNYEVALEGLNNFTNVVTLGYVPVSWGNRNISTVLGEISCYAAWPNHTNPNIAVKGIFFDETTSAMTNETFAYMNNITTFARGALGPDRSHIAFNPGVAVDPAFYELADTINVFENDYSAFNLSVLNSTSWDLLARSTFLVHHFPYDDVLQADLINNLTDSNVGGMLITTQESYNELSNLWPEFCEELANKNDGGDLPNGDVLPIHPEILPPFVVETTV